MGRFKKSLGLAFVAVAITLCGCANMGLTLDQQVRVAADDASGYAKLDYPSQWHFMGYDGQNQTESPEEGASYMSVLVSPNDITTEASADDISAQVVAGCITNSTGIHPDSSDEAINEYFDSMITNTFPDATDRETSITRDGDSTTVEFSYTAPYESKTITSKNKYVLIGDYVFSVSGVSVSDADETTVATTNAIVDDFGYVINSAS